MEPQTRYAKSGGLRIAYQVTGAGPAARGRASHRSHDVGGQRHARLVIGADGRNSRIARLAGARTYHDNPPVTFAYYTYWRGCPVAGVHAWLEPGRVIRLFRTHCMAHQVALVIPG